MYIDNRARPIEWSLIGNASLVYIQYIDRSVDLNKIARYYRVLCVNESPKVHRKFVCPCYNINQPAARSAVKELLLHYNPTESPLPLFVISIDGILPYEYTINVCRRARSIKYVNWIDYFCYSFARASSRRVNDGSKWNWFGWSGLRREGERESGSRGVQRSYSHLQFRFQPLMLTPRSFVRIWPSSAGLRIKWIQIRKIDTLQPFHSFHCIRGAPHWFARGNDACCSVYKSALSISFRFSSVFRD